VSDPWMRDVNEPAVFGVELAAASNVGGLLFGPEAVKGIALA